MNLFRATPNAFVTPVLIAINVLVFLAMVANGVPILNPGTDVLLKWGADFGPAVTHGQWWRLLTAAFLHAGILHIGMNMYVLYGVGPFTERLFGNLGYIVIYFLSALFGSLTSVTWQPFIVSVGASGAVFGVYGALLGFLLRERRTIPAERLKSLVQNALVFVVLNMAIGMNKSGIDMGAHAGGFIGGFLVGCALARPLVPIDGRGRAMRAFAVATVGGALVVALTLRLPAADDLSSEIDRFEAVENGLNKSFNEAGNKLDRKELSPAEFSQLVSGKLVPAYRDEIVTLGKLKIGGRQQQMVSKIQKYLALRADGWSMIADGVRTSDSRLVEAGKAKTSEAEASLK